MTPAPPDARRVLPAEVWQARVRAHADRADALTAAYRERRAGGRTHPVEDFPFDYYGIKPALLRRWHPGVGVVLDAAPEGPAEHAGWRWYVTDAGRVALDVAAFVADRGDTVRYVHDLLTATAARPVFTGCLGLHEWAMVYRQDDHGRRHPLPLRLGREGTDAVVEAHPVRCSHFDAFRFFTPDAVGRNRLQPTRANQVRLEQPGCLHANLDLTKWSLKLGPAVPGDLLLDCFTLGTQIRRLDMQASPYDLSSLGETPVRIETADGRSEYVRRQREYARQAADLRERLITVCGGVLAAAGPPARRDRDRPSSHE